MDFRTWIRSLLFVAIGGVLAVLLDQSLIAGLRRCRTGDYGVWNAVVDGKATADVAVFGSSRALVHFDCERIAEILGRRCWNLGLNGSPPNLQRPLEELYLQRNPAPGVIAIALDVTSLEIRRDPYNPAQYLPYLSEPTLYENLVSLDGDFQKYRYVPLYGFAVSGYRTTEAAVRGLLQREQQQPRVYGYLPMDSAWDGAFETFVTMNPSGKAFPVETEAIAALDKMISRARDSGAEVVLVYPPELKEAQRYTTNRDELMRTFKGLALKYGARFLDYSDDALSLDRTFFYNSQHLNRNGSRRFSEMFARDISSIGPWNRADAASRNAR